MAPPPTRILVVQGRGETLVLGSVVPAVLLILPAPIRDFLGSC
jgi:hypothetical protein